LDQTLHLLSSQTAPRRDNEQEVEQFLNHLAVEKHVAASTQNQALCALVFLYREVLAKETGVG
jgi:hypothetical protein